ncbi:MAG: DinB family protein [Vicinamibacterales bacterium]
MDYTSLSLAAVRHGLELVGRDVRERFQRLDSQQLNWRPAPTRWSVGQCLEHLLSANALMLAGADAALGGAPRTLWQRLPVMPRVLGRLLIRSQAPEVKRKFTADPRASPSNSEVTADVVQRFLQQQQDIVARLDVLDERAAARVIMTSPFMRLITYSVLDGWRLVYAHECRHVQQARRVTEEAGFPTR